MSVQMKTASMNEIDIEWHSYENKNNRPIRVMARNLHSSIDCDDIVMELEEKKI